MLFAVFSVALGVALFRFREKETLQSEHDAVLFRLAVEKAVSALYIMLLREQPAPCEAERTARMKRRWVKPIR
jgi:hypothetical protein